MATYWNFAYTLMLENKSKRQKKRSFKQHFLTFIRLKEKIRSFKGKGQCCSYFLIAIISCIYIASTTTSIILLNTQNNPWGWYYHEFHSTDGKTEV